MIPRNARYAGLLVEEEAAAMVPSARAPCEPVRDGRCSGSVARSPTAPWATITMIVTVAADG
jgi:hypothetical protein